MKKKGNVVLLGCGIVFLLVSLLGCKADPQMYSVTFDSQEGSEVAVQTVQENGKATRPADPTMTGYITLDNWYADDTFATVWDFDTPITKDTTLHANWRDLTIRDTGPSGGYVFYDKGAYTDGWRYLEAAPAGWSGSSDPMYIFGFNRGSDDVASTLVGTQTAIGTGKANTAALVAAMGEEAYMKFDPKDGAETTADYAAKVCAEYSIVVDTVTYDDWFLPSKDELNQMYLNLKENSLGGFSDNRLWSSSEKVDFSAWNQIFENGKQKLLGSGPRAQCQACTGFLMSC